MIQSSEIFDLEGSKVSAEMETVTFSSDVFDGGDTIYTRTLPGYEDKYKYVCFGDDNQLPFEMIRLVGENQVMSQNKLFNVLTCYGAGLKYIDNETNKATKDKEIRNFQLHNSLPLFFLEQSTDMKYFFFSVAVLILSKDGKKIVQLKHKEACYCRFEKADEHGIIKHVFYANWKDVSLDKDKIEVIPLLDTHDPLGDLEVRMGRKTNKRGEKLSVKERKFAILLRFPTPGLQYYPIPYYTSIFRDSWYDIMKLIGIGKRAKLKNHASVKYQVEVHKDYWQNILKDEHITDPVAQAERLKKEKNNIRDFVSGIENSGKVWITGYYIDPNGVECRMVRVNTIDAGKEGGDWSDDIQESSNMCCYGDNIHPNLVGATPGKSQSNNSGSDKRELFTLKQSLETAFHDLLSMVHDIVIEFNEWSDKVHAEIPMILLTTLDQNTDAKTTTVNENNDGNK